MYKVTKLEQMKEVEKLIKASVRIFGNLSPDTEMTEEQIWKYMSKKQKKQ